MCRPVKNLSHGQSCRRKCSYNEHISNRITLPPNACKEKLICDLFQTLYTYPDNFRAYKALIAAKYSGASVKTDPKFVFGETNKSKQFLAKFPFGKVGELHFLLVCHFLMFHHHQFITILCLPALLLCSLHFTINS